MDRVIGIDVSKARLDVHDLAEGGRLAVANDAAGLAALADRLGLGPQDLLVMEGSGGYERTAHRWLSERGLKVAIVNAARVRAFARASGLLAKLVHGPASGRTRGTDRLDAALIARYGAFARPAATPLLTGARQALAELLAYRRQLTAEITARTQQLGHLLTSALRQRAQAALTRLRGERQEVTQLIRQTIEADRELAEAAALLQTMPGVGPVLVATLLADLPELGTLDRRRVASLAGVAPIAKDSGTKQGRRPIRGGRSQLRPPLYMAALVASRSNPTLRATYERLINNGKPPQARPRRPHAPTPHHPQHHAPHQLTLAPSSRQRCMTKTVANHTGRMQRVSSFAASRNHPIGARISIRSPMPGPRVPDRALRPEW